MYVPTGSADLWNGVNFREQRGGIFWLILNKVVEIINECQNSVYKFRSPHQALSDKTNRIKIGHKIKK